MFFQWVAVESAPFFIFHNKGENKDGNYSREEILQLIEDEDVEFIRLQFTDMFGVIKNIAVTSRELPRALDNRCNVDWSLVTGENGGAGDGYFSSSGS